MPKFLLEKYLAHICITPEYIKRHCTCGVGQPQVPCPVADIAHSLSESFMVYISPCTLGTHKANTKTIFAGNKSLFSLSEILKPMVSLSRIQQASSLYDLFQQKTVS